MNIKGTEELAGEKFLSSTDVDARIAYLLSGDRPRFSDGELQDRQEELEELETFRNEVAGYAGAARWNNGMTLVRDDAWDEFAEDEAESLYGREAVQSGYLALDRIAQDLQAGYQDADLQGITFWYR
jgi:hypothetical protein